MIIYFGKKILHALLSYSRVSKGTGMRVRECRSRTTESRFQPFRKLRKSYSFTSCRSAIIDKLLSFGESVVANKNTLQNNVDHKLWQFLSVGLESLTLCLWCHSFLLCSLTSNKKCDIRRCSESFCNNPMLCQCTSKILKKKGEHTKCKIYKDDIVGP